MTLTIPSGTGAASVCVDAGLIFCLMGGTVLSKEKRNYEHSPIDIEERSFEIIRNTLSCYAIDEGLMDITVRVVHAGADFSLANLIESRNDALESAYDALRQGGQIFCDVEMLKSGISRGECGRLGL